jgi:hypothetical protein
LWNANAEELLAFLKFVALPPAGLMIREDGIVKAQYRSTRNVLA